LSANIRDLQQTLDVERAKWQAENQRLLLEQQEMEARFTTERESWESQAPPAANQMPSTDAEQSAWEAESAEESFDAFEDSLRKQWENSSQATAFDDDTTGASVTESDQAETADDIWPADGPLAGLMRHVDEPEDDPFQVNEQPASELDYPFAGRLTENRQSEPSESEERGRDTMSLLGDIQEHQTVDFDSSGDNDSLVIAETTEEDAHEDSIEEYMKQLLARVGTGTPLELRPTPVRSPEPKPQPKAPPKPVETPTPITSPEEFVPRSSAPERHTNLAAMRELANQSVKSAIQHHSKTRESLSVRFRLTIAALLFGFGLFGMFMASSLVSLSALLAFLCIGASAVVAVQALLPSGKKSKKGQAAGATEDVIESDVIDE
ncbi:MAG: hypothetical protein KDA99_15855, partial [Planctomycetales bacterium]|nr:hypothetical protein [Planctomycetales bacterium]